MVHDGPSMEVPVEEDDQLVEDTDVDPHESLEDKYLDIEYDGSDDSDEELDIEYDELEELEKLGLHIDYTDNDDNSDEGEVEIITENTVMVIMVKKKR